jgi:hypothetical protein
MWNNKSALILLMHGTNMKITYLLTPWSRVLLEKITGSAASQGIPRIIYWIIYFETAVNFVLLILCTFSIILAFAATKYPSLRRSVLSD